MPTIIVCAIDRQHANPATLNCQPITSVFAQFSASLENRKWAFVQGLIVGYWRPQPFGIRNETGGFVPDSVIDLLGSLINMQAPGGHDTAV